MYWKLFIIKVLKIIMLLLLVNNNYSFPQMPPHPKLLENIKNGIIPKPYFLQNIEKIRAKGVDAPRFSNDLMKKRNLKKTFKFSAYSDSPNGEEQWRVRTTHNIKWGSISIDSVKIEYSVDNITNTKNNTPLIRTPIHTKKTNTLN